MSFDLFDLQGTGDVTKDDAISIMHILGYKVTKLEILELTNAALLNNSEADGFNAPKQMITFEQFRIFYSNKMVKMSLDG